MLLTIHGTISHNLGEMKLPHAFTVCNVDENWFWSVLRFAKLYVLIMHNGGQRAIWVVHTTQVA